MPDETLRPNLDVEYRLASGWRRARAMDDANVVVELADGEDPRAALHGLRGANVIGRRLFARFVRRGDDVGCWRPLP